MAHTLQAPTGLRDFYPADLLRRRYIEKLWRDTAIRHGFEEIDGPTFEHAELYKIKSGEGILNEMFGVFSGKDESQRAALAQGEAPYALRPEFTPTLARLYAAKAATLPKPCKWFWQQNCYRAEKPQRGRLREFMQWNCDVIGTENEPEAQARADAEVIGVSIALLALAGLQPERTSPGVTARICDRSIMQMWFASRGVPEVLMPLAFELRDRALKEPTERLHEVATRAGMGWDAQMSVLRARAIVVNAGAIKSHGPAVADVMDVSGFNLLDESLLSFGIDEWCRFDTTIARGLAYYTGMVFEVIAEGERAIAGGGRYDNLIELFGGPPTPAVGFGMGDVVLSLLLADKGLMPEGKDLLEALSAPAASFRPDAFVISNGTPEADAAVRPLVAKLRRGTESAAWLAKEGRKPWEAARYGSVGEDDPAARPVHARHTYKTTKNVGKLLKEASDQHARAAVIIESGEHATVRNLETREEQKDVPLNRVPGVIAGLVAG
ncbi:MAG: ATP phosphoribosyltransferase regulatory subunit [Phycisphaerales bacterium]|nr:ATP phosphoribosyltransferase regulatory subunit [Phycisphaerales bacterium]